MSGFGELLSVPFSPFCKASKCTLLEVQCDCTSQTGSQGLMQTHWLPSTHVKPFPVSYGAFSNITLIIKILASATDFITSDHCK